MRNATPTSRRISKTLMITAAGLIGISLSASSVSALLTAEAKNTSAHAITSGTLKLIMAPGTGSVGFGSTISDMAPTDVVNRYVDYTNNGSLASKNLKLRVSDTVNSLLTTDGTKGLKVTVSDCSGGWTVSDGSCASTKTVVLASTALSTLKAADQAFSGITTLAANTGVLHLQFSITLPDSTETTTNGVFDAGASTIQGLNANLTWTLTETQRELAASNG